MKGLCVLLALAAVVSFGVTGCGDNSNSILNPDDPSFDQGYATSLAKGPVVASASGSANMHLFPPWGPPGVYRVCTFNAREYSDGSYSGELLERSVIGQVASFQGEILQVKVQGNLAKLIFHVTKADGRAAGLLGLNVCYVVQDNGEGANAASPDMNTFFWEFDPADTQWWLDLTPSDFVALLESSGYPGLIRVENGNVQVWGNSY